jgi:phosphoglycolate phosphatase-like HAD superfamily hydrolase
VIDVFARANCVIADHDVIGHEVRQTKTEKILGLLAARNVDPADAVYVGDMESDVLYCRDVPVRCIAVSYGYHPHELLEASGALAVCTSPVQLFDTLETGLSLGALR